MELLAKALITSPKTDIQLSPWKSGKLPPNTLPLRRGCKGVSQGNSWRWRIITFFSQGKECRLWLNYNYSKLIYRATLAFNESGFFKIVCIKEFHPSEPGWHCHSSMRTERGVSDFTHRMLNRYPKFDRLTHSVAAMGIETEQEATSFALQFFRIEEKGDLI